MSDAELKGKDKLELTLKLEWIVCSIYFTSSDF